MTDSKGKMKIVEVLSTRKYFGIAMLSTILMVVIYVYTQVLGIIENIDVWIRFLPPLNGIMFGAFSLLFGVSMAYQIYLWKQPKICSVKTRIKGSGTSSLSTLGIFLVAQCPACASLGALFLPLSAITFINTWGWAINLLGIGLLLFTLNYLGAFKRT